MTNYERGRSYEYRVIAKLRKQMQEPLYYTCNPGLVVQRWVGLEVDAPGAWSRFVINDVDIDVVDGSTINRDGRGACASEVWFIAKRPHTDILSNDRSVDTTEVASKIGNAVPLVAKPGSRPAPHLSSQFVHRHIGTNL